MQFKATQYVVNPFELYYALKVVPHFTKLRYLAEAGDLMDEPCDEE